MTAKRDIPYPPITGRRDDARSAGLEGCAATELRNIRVKVVRWLLLVVLVIGGLSGAGPARAVTGKPLSAFATPGELEPAAFCVSALKELKGVTVECGELVAEVTASPIDIG